MSTPVSDRCISPPRSPEGDDPMTTLGFTALEAEVYTLLLGESTAVTGYRLAQSLRKPAANVYKAIESLAAKGAVMVDDGRHRKCRAVPPEELLSRLDRRFQEARKRAAHTLAQHAQPATDHRVYQLHSLEAVLERARAMLQRAREVVAIDAFPSAIAELAGEVEATAKRGPLVMVKAYQPLELDGVEVVVQAKGALTMERWTGGEWLNLVVDGRELLISFLDWQRSQVHQAIWSGSAYLAWVYHSSLGDEIILAELTRQLEAGTDVAGLRQTLARLETFKARRARGYQELVAKIDPPPRSPQGDEPIAK